ncbi:MAG: HD domain-containing protein [Candidatus Babeliales bacterium]
MLKIAVIVSLLASWVVYPIEIETLYGTLCVEEPVLVELIQSEAMQRLKGVHQYGPIYYVKPTAEYSRFIHSLGVLYLVRQFGGSLFEQIAALLHDVSHTVFSHVGDHFFKCVDGDYSYQDTIHLQFIRDTDIAAILDKYGIAVENIDHKSPTFTRLESKHPNICADRLEYVLYGGFIEHVLTQDDARFIIAALVFIDNQWVFTDRGAARLFADTSLYLTEQVFATAINNVVYYWTAKALRRACKIGLISLPTISHGTDSYVWGVLCGSSDAKLTQLIDVIRHYSHHYRVVDALQPYDMHFVSKFRGIDPLVLVDNHIDRLTNIDDAYANRYLTCKSHVCDGMYVNFM